MSRDEDLEPLFTPEVKRCFLNVGLEVITPAEASAMRTILVRQIDKHIDDYSDMEIKDYIEEQNRWAKVDLVRKLKPSQG